MLFKKEMKSRRLQMLKNALKDMLALLLRQQNCYKMILLIFLTILVERYREHVCVTYYVIGCVICGRC